MDHPFEELLKQALQAGLDAVGVCSAGPFPEVRESLERMRRNGTSGRLRFTFAEPAVSTDVRASFGWAKRLLVGGRTYLPHSGDPGPPAPGTGRIARFAVDDGYAPLRRALGSVAEMLHAGGFRAEVLVDDNRLVDRAAAVRSGVGWWGKNTMVLAPGYGPWLLLGAVVTDADLPVSAPMVRDCGTCSACLPACPTGALTAAGVLDATRCLAYWAQTSGVVPPPYRAAMGDRIYGCDDCLEACPPGSKLLDTAKARRRGRVDLHALLTTSDHDLLQRYDHFYVPRNQARYLRRNALIALGNTGDGDSVELLVGYLNDPDRLLRIHAAWALGKIGGLPAAAWLAERATTETDPEVREEIERALSD